METIHVKLVGMLLSPFVNRVVLALKIKSVDYELVEVNPHEKSGILVEANPVHKKIPILIHGDKPVCESLIIVRYIDEAWNEGPSILLQILMIVRWPFSGQLRSMIMYVCIISH